MKKAPEAIEDVELLEAQARSFQRWMLKAGFNAHEPPQIFVDSWVDFARQIHAAGFRSGGRYAIGAMTEFADIPALLQHINNRMQALQELLERRPPP